MPQTWPLPGSSVSPQPPPHILCPQSWASPCVKAQPPPRPLSLFSHRRPRWPEPSFCTQSGSHCLREGSPHLTLEVFPGLASQPPAMCHSPACGRIPAALPISPGLAKGPRPPHTKPSGGLRQGRPASECPGSRTEPLQSSPGGPGNPESHSLPSGRVEFQSAWGQRGWGRPRRLVNLLRHQCGHWGRGQRDARGPGSDSWQPSSEACLGRRDLRKVHLLCALQVGRWLREGGATAGNHSAEQRPRCVRLPPPQVALDAGLLL